MSLVVEMINKDTGIAVSFKLDHREEGIFATVGIVRLGPFTNEGEAAHAGASEALRQYDVTTKGFDTKRPS